MLKGLTGALTTPSAANALGLFAQVPLFTTSAGRCTSAKRKKKKEKRVKGAAAPAGRPHPRGKAVAARSAPSSSDVARVLVLRRCAGHRTGARQRPAGRPPPRGGGAPGCSSNKISANRVDCWLTHARSRVSAGGRLRSWGFESA